MNSLLSSLRNSDDYELQNALLDICTQYNRNQELYNQNMEMMLGTINTISNARNNTRAEYSRTNARTEPPRTNTRSTNRSNNNDLDEHVYEFALPTNISDMLLRWLQLDPSGQSLTLSNQEIANATTVYNHTSVSDEPLVCPISLDTIEYNESVMKINRCGHIFKEQALRRWLQRDNKCPVCRGRL